MQAGRLKADAARLACGVLAVCLAGCGSLVGEKRHSPAEIAGYGTERFTAEIASQAGREAAHEKARDAIRRALAGESEEATIAAALHAVRFLNSDPAQVRGLLLAALPGLPGRDAGFQRAVLTAAHASHARESAEAVWAILPGIRTPREFAIGAYSVLRGDPARRMALAALLERQFPDLPDEPRLVALREALSADQEAVRAARPPLVDLLAAPLRPGRPVLFSFQRRDRQHFGLAVVRSAEGRFVREADGSLFNVAQLAMALSDLPGTITNGNTPQGLFTIVGAGTATNQWIGPTPYLHAKVPVEATVAEFEHAPTDQAWSEPVYESFLPVAWRSYRPFKEAWLAGRAGRDEMLAHGTTVQPALYRDSPWYPGTPSAGCLVAMEYWNEEGRLVHSDQLALAKAFTAGGFDSGYLVVVELDDRRQPVSLAEVLPDLLAAEARLRAR